MNNPWNTINKPQADINVKLVGDKHPLKMYWGRDAQGRYLFVYDCPKGSAPQKKDLPNLSGISSAIVPDRDKQKLLLILNEAENWELFLTLCSDLIRSTEQTKDPKIASSIILRRLRRWQEFLRRERAQLLSIEAIKGLIGELLFVSEVLSSEFNWNDAINFWKGPEDAPQDFAVYDTAVEVKCQSGSTKPFVKISSVEQLEPQLPMGYLVVYTIASAETESPESFTLNSLVKNIRTILHREPEETRERFEDLLLRADYVTREEYDNLTFQKVSVVSYELQDGFPRIKISDIPQGIDKTTYNLKLEACADFVGKPSWWRD